MFRKLFSADAGGKKFYLRSVLDENDQSSATLNEENGKKIYKNRDFFFFLKYYKRECTCYIILDCVI